MKIQCASSSGQIATMKNLILFQIARTSDVDTKDEDTDGSNLEEKMLMLKAQKKRLMVMVKRMKVEEEALELQLARVRNLHFY